MSNNLHINIHDAAPNVSSRDNTIWLDISIPAGEITLFLSPVTAKRVGELLIKAADYSGRIMAVEAEQSA